MKCELCEIEIKQPNIVTDVHDYIDNGHGAIRIKFNCDRCDHNLATVTIGAELSTSAEDDNVVRITGQNYRHDNVPTIFDIDLKRSFKVSTGR